MLKKIEKQIIQKNMSEGLYRVEISFPGVNKVVVLENEKFQKENNN